MPSRWFSSLSTPNKTALVLALIMLFLSMIKSGYYTLHYGGTDLRTRVVGARLLHSGQSPYSHKWSPADPEQLADPNDTDYQHVNGVSAAPGILYLQSLFTSLKYPFIRIAWTAFLYLLAFLVFASVLTEKTNTPKANMLIITIGGLLFLCSSVWFLNVERGQIYILFTTFFAAIYYLCQQQKKWTTLLAGILIALAVYCHPIMIVIIIPFILSRNWTLLTGTGIASIPLAIHAWLHIGLWRDYASAIWTYTHVPTSTTLTHYPPVIEGARNLTQYNTGFTVGGINPMRSWMPRWLFSDAIYLCLYALVIVFFTLLFRKKLHNNARILLLCFLLYIFSEYMLPATRNAGTLIEWLFPVLLLLKKEYLPTAKLILLIAGLCLINSLPFYMAYLQGIGELLLLYCVYMYLNSHKKQTGLI